MAHTGLGRGGGERAGVGGGLSIPLMTGVGTDLVSFKFIALRPRLVLNLFVQNACKSFTHAPPSPTVFKHLFTGGTPHYLQQMPTNPPPQRHTL